MKRRGFLKLLGSIPAVIAGSKVFAAPNIEQPKLVAVPENDLVDGNKLFKGEVGRYEGIRIISTNKNAAKAWAKMVDEDLSKSSTLAQYLRTGKYVL